MLANETNDNVNQWHHHIFFQNYCLVYGLWKIIEIILFFLYPIQSNMLELQQEVLCSFSCIAEASLGNISIKLELLVSESASTY